jgi:hypothetical protein
VSPIDRIGASATWNGPSTVFSVAGAGRRLFSASTSIDTPSVSLSRMNSWRSFEQICPVRVKNSIATSHSSPVSCTSLIKAWRWRTSAAMTVARRGSVPSPTRALTVSAEPVSVK